MPVNHVLLETIYLTQSAASVTFDNIPQTGYTDLKIVASTRSPISGYGTDMTLAFNGSTANFSGRRIYGYSATAYSDTQSNVGGLVVGGTATTSTFATNELYIYDYTSSNNKSYSMEAVSENNSTTAYLLELSTNFWTNPAAITSITFGVSTSTFSPYSSFSLYGIASTGTTPVTAPKAQGGNIVANDGTYWYHAFLSSGTFTPTVALTCDYLVVAGGGAGGYSNGAGGGAGGYRTSIGGSPLSVTAQTYSILVGAGGASTTNASMRNSGTDSTFSTITSTGGGGGGSSGGSGEAAGLSGGSGGGARGYWNLSAGSGNTPSTSPSQGNNGGSAGAGPAYGSGGGGGAGSAGGNGTSSSGGAGGAGSNSASALTSATLTGVSGYFAGGGGGARENGAGASGGAGGGGNGGGLSTAPTSATINTGSGGGGGGYGGGDQGGSGASGIVIIRYTMA